MANKKHAKAAPYINTMDFVPLIMKCGSIYMMIIIFMDPKH